MDVSELNRMLIAAGVERACQWILPSSNWVRRGPEYQIGDLYGSAGKSLSVRISGDRAGRWKDFADNGPGGDLVDLLRRARQIDMGEAVRLVKERFDVVEVKSQKRRREYKRPPATDPHRRPIAPDDGAGRSPVFEYLTGERRLSAQTVQRFGVQEKLIRGRPFVCFRYLSPGGELLNVKYLGVERPGGKKETLQEPGAEPSLYGWQAIAPGDRYVVLTEGEIDAMSWHELGFPALSIPNGIGTGSKLDWIETEAANLDRFDTIYLSFDNETDPALKKTVDETAEAIAVRLGRHRCPVVRLPEKDANAALQAGTTAETMNARLDKAETIDPKGVKWVGVYRDATLERWFGAPLHGVPLPWFPPVGRKALELLPGQTTILLGIPTHGKTNLSLQMLNHAGFCKVRSCLASFEIPTVESISMQQRMIIGHSPQNDAAGLAEVHAAQDKIDDYMIQIDNGDNLGMGLDTLLEYWIYSHARFDCRLFCLDSFMCLDGLKMEDFEGQKQAMKRLVEFARSRAVHVIVVMHPNKKTDPTRIPGMYDVIGSSPIVNLAHNGISIWRNIAKEHGEQTKEQADAVVEVWKSRTVGQALARYKLRYRVDAGLYEPMDGQGLNDGGWHQRDDGQYIKAYVEN